MGRHVYAPARLAVVGKPVRLVRSSALACSTIAVLRAGSEDFSLLGLHASGMLTVSVEQLICRGGCGTPSFLLLQMQA